MFRENFIFVRLGAFTNLAKLLSITVTLGLMALCAGEASGANSLDKAKYHTWEEVNAYLNDIADYLQLRRL